MGALLRTGRDLVTQALLAQRGQGLCWVPVCLGIGIGGYFALRFEPGAGHFAGAVLVALALLTLARVMPESVSPFATGLAICLLGFTLAGLRAHAVSGPVLDWRYYGPVTGRIVAMDRSQSDAPRLTLDRVRLHRVPVHKVPERVRISLHSDIVGIPPEPGLRVMTTAHLSPPAGPVEPGGFDFQRHAWFARLGAVGYARVPLLGAAAPEPGDRGLAVFRLRMAASARIQSHLPGDVGGFAAAITTGDRSAISREALENLRASNLAHLLAISGLHMGLLSALIFGLLRFCFALVPRLVLRWPVKEIAAFGALLAAAVYLALSGGNVATQRAFIMVAVALAALMLGRRALSLRAVAVAATLVLVLRPEALTGPGFQMSFAATTALVVVFRWISGRDRLALARWLRPAFGVFVSSLVAGLATAPIAAAHFNTLAHYGLVANLASVPLMGVLVMPAAVLALVLSPFGLEGPGLWLMGAGLRWILWVAETVSGWENARGFVVAPDPAVLPLIALGAVFFVLWRGAGRFIGLVGVVFGFWLWSQSVRPAVLIAESGGLVGWMTPEGRALSRERTAGFVARTWLENDGDGAVQEVAARRVVPEEKASAVVHLSGKRAVAAFDGCAGPAVVVASVPVEGILPGGCRVLDPPRLRRTGAIALYRAAGGWREVTARGHVGERLWTRWPDQ